MKGVISMLQDVVKELSEKYNKSEKFVLLLIKICKDNNVKLEEIRENLDINLTHFLTH